MKTVEELENEYIYYRGEHCRDGNYHKSSEFDGALSALKDINPYIKQLESKNKELKEKVDMFNNVIEFIGELKDNCSYQVVELKKQSEV